MQTTSALRLGICLLLGAIGLLLAPPLARAQTPAWQQELLINTTGNGGVSIKAITTTANHDVYIAGTIIGSVTIGTNTLTSVGYEDIFVARWSAATSSFVWAKSAGGTGFDEVQAIAVNGTNVYIGGKFNSSSGVTQMAFGSFILSGNNGAGFVAKLAETSGRADFAWAYSVEGQGTDGVTALALNGNSLYVAGYFGGSSVSFGLLGLATGAGSFDVFVAKLTDTNAAPQFNWLQRAGSNGDDEATAIQVSGTSVYVAGIFTGTVAFGPNVLTTVGTAQQASDMFVAKLTDAGSAANWTWGAQGGGDGYDNPVALALNGSSVYVAGNFSSSTFVCGATTLLSANAASNGAIISDVFVAKLVDTGAAGQIIWAQQAGGRGDDRAYGLEVSGASLFVAGMFDSPIATFGGTLLTKGSNYSDLYLTKLLDGGSSGAFSWTKQATGQAYVGAYAMTARGNRIYVAGFLNGSTADFGLFTLFKSGGLYATYVVAVTDATLTATTGASPDESIDLFPNPAHGRATVQLPAIAGATTATLTVLDALGRTVRTQTAPTNARTELDLSGLPAGLYAVRVAAGSVTATRRLVVE